MVNGLPVEKSILWDIGVRGLIKLRALFITGEVPNNVYSGSGEKNFTIDFNDDWHLFSIEWDVNGIRWFVDSQQCHKESLKRNMWSGKGQKNPYCKEGQPFDEAFFWIINAAVGGNYFPQQTYGALTVEEAKEWFKPTMDVDFVRVYEWKYILNLEKKKS
jgi:hypothetical protein